MILQAARQLRPMLPLAWEYRLRRCLNLVLPVQSRADVDAVFHVCVWKSASQWVRVVLSDPRIYRYSGLSACLADSFLRSAPEATRFPRRSIVTALMRPYPFFAAVAKPARHSAFFVKRDPRDLVVSFYFSNRYSHRPNPEVTVVRQQLSRLSERDGLLLTIDQFAPFVEILSSWQQAVGQRPALSLVRYEDLTGVDQLNVWHALLNRLGINIPRQTMADVLATYSFARITGGRQPGDEVKTEKYRKGVAGDWQSYFDAEVTRAFRARCGDLVEELGYQW